MAALSELVGDDLAWVGVPGSEGFEEGLAYASFREVESVCDGAGGVIPAAGVAGRGDGGCGREGRRAGEVGQPLVKEHINQGSSVVERIGEGCGSSAFK